MAITLSLSTIMIDTSQRSSHLGGATDTRSLHKDSWPVKMATTNATNVIIADFPKKVKCVDDTCTWAGSIEAAFFQTYRWLDLCARNGITLNPKKFQFAEDTVEFAGMTVTTTNIKPNTKFLNSILHFPTPTDISGARALFGLVNKGVYAFAMA
ncbi:enzymatic polyprotein [Plakobranchus ocellatus]|uniref:Enzymatic polyprotein n=1 Tax=Plakobranchus ocellatus TaxID=259542 RepID=A0AAV4AWC1_9GAST|nr:enzymatic polyprotein [Plakobranchus ocellatus]